MALYNRFFEGYDNDTNGGKIDLYHGEDDDQAYGDLYIPYIEAELANLASLKKVFNANKIGLVTSATFNALVAPTTYKGKNKKQVFSAVIYVKWNDTPTVTKFRESIFNGDKVNSRIHVNKGKNVHWVVRPNTAQLSDELMEERYFVNELAETAIDAGLRVLEDDEDDEDMYELEETAKVVALRALEDKDELTMYCLEQTARSVAFSVLIGA